MKMNSFKINIGKLIYIVQIILINFWMILNDKYKIFCLLNYNINLCKYNFLP